MLPNGKPHLDQYGQPYGASRGYSQDVNIDFTRVIPLKKYVRDWWFTGAVSVPIESAAVEDFKKHMQSKIVFTKGLKCGVGVSDEGYKTSVEIEFDSSKKKIFRFYVDGTQAYTPATGAFFLSYDNQGLANCSAKLLE